MTKPTDDERYEGRPLVRVLDLYVLSLIGELPVDSSAVVAELIRRTFPSSPDDTWQAALERELHLGPNLKRKIQTMWAGYQSFERNHGRGAESARFVRSVVDENFLPLIDRR
jgi:hypothetical protein